MSTYADYVRLENDSATKHEFCAGEIRAMPQAGVEHGALAAAVISGFGSQCRVLSSDVRVRIATSDLTTYPDLSVVSGRAHHDATDTHAITNPVVVVEVTSPSSEDYDHGEKLSHYKQLPSLKAVVIVSHKTRRVTVHARSATWETREYRSGETATLAEPELRLDVDRLYAVLDGL